MQNFYLYFIVFFLLFVIPAINFRRFNRARIARKHKMSKGKSIMNELVNQFIGKECYITCPGVTTYSGTVETVADNWLKLVEKNGAMRLVNLEYVNDIKEIKKKVK